MIGHTFPDQVAELMAVADGLPVGHARLTVREQAVRAADVLGDTAAGYRTRRVLIDDAASCMRYDLYAVAFAWCIAAARSDPARFPLLDLLDHYQHVIGKMVNFPDVSREQYEGLFADVVRTFREYGLSLRTAYLQRRSVAIDFGDREMARVADDEWRKHRRDGLSASAECETCWQLEHLCFMGDDPAAARVVDEYLARPRREPHFETWLSSLALLPLLRLGRAAEAEVRYRTAARTKTIAGYVWSRACHVEYLALVGDFKRGGREFEAQLPAALAQPDPLSRYHCLRPAALLLDRMAADGARTATLRVPPGVPCGERRGVAEVSPLREWVWAEAMRIASQFDERNGNDYYSGWLHRTAERT